jgi:cytidine deaminase
MLTQAQKDELIRQAIDARKNSYSPYSKYAVGSALLTKTGKIYTGANVENAVLPLTNCAERTAIFKAVTDGEKLFEAIVVVTENAGTPCGSCRQVMAEFNLDMPVIIADTSGKIACEMTVAQLLPGAFTPKDLIP